VRRRPAGADAGSRWVGGQVNVHDADQSVSKQVSGVADMLQRKIDTLLLTPSDSTGIKTAVVPGKTAGGVSGAVDANANGAVDAFVGSKKFGAGGLSSEYLAKAVGGGEVGIRDGIAVVPVLERVGGCRAALAKVPGVRIVDVQNGRRELASALAVTENLIHAHPVLKGGVSVNDGGPTGAPPGAQASGGASRPRAAPEPPEAAAG
ncbi:substrate-binding domain-containing protein, partial [Burkholderia pseudomallei]|uniref:substrate-binding domain-containing protein n=1 Tax=Burkholderia pseudomallei TaxID=28450 RepID=UPI0021F74954